eukprot:579380-Pelagomonas_calceolata.AAC.3
MFAAAGQQLGRAAASAHSLAEVSAGPHGHRPGHHWPHLDLSCIWPAAGEPDSLPHRAFGRGYGMQALKINLSQTACLHISCSHRFH